MIWSYTGAKSQGQNRDQGHAPGRGPGHAQALKGMPTAKAMARGHAEGQIFGKANTNPMAIQK